MTAPRAARSGAVNCRAVRRAVKNFPQTVQRYHGASGQENQRSANTGEGFHFPMAVWVFGIRRTLGILEGKPDERRTKNIECGFETISDQSIRMSQPTSSHLHHGEQEIDEHTREQDGSALGSSLGECGHSESPSVSACGKA
jgi:hypothetical protein